MSDACPNCDSDATRAYYEGAEFGTESTLYACQDCRHTWVDDE